MRVREWEPAKAPDSDLDTWLRLYNGMLASDLPGEPLWRTDGLRDYLSATMPEEHRIDWFAEDRGDAAIGTAALLLLDDLGVFEVYVDSRHRRAGVGRALLLEGARRAHRLGRDILGVEVAAGTPGTRFYPAMGFTLSSVEQRSILTLTTVDWDAIGEHSLRTGSGYKIEYFPGGPPRDLLEQYALAKRTVAGENDLRPSSYSPERLAESLATLHARGLTPHVVCAVHSRTGVIAGLSEVVTPTHRPERADQYDTVVVPAHRGYGLGLAMKARLLVELRSAAPGLRTVQTWTSVENEQMFRVNTELGFVPDRAWHEYEAEVPVLLARLG